MRIINVNDFSQQQHSVCSGGFSASNNRQCIKHDQSIIRSDPPTIFFGDPTYIFGGIWIQRFFNIKKNILPCFIGARVVRWHHLWTVSLFSHCCLLWMWSYYIYTIDMGDQLSKQVAMFARVCRCIMCVVFLWGAWKTIYALSGSHMVNGIVENRLQPASHFSHHSFAFSKRYSMYYMWLL